MLCGQNTQVAEVIQEPGEPVWAGFIETSNNVRSYTKFMETKPVCISNGQMEMDNFVPQGKPGEKGEKGDQGKQGETVT